jgi:hypothetical protein
MRTSSFTSSGATHLKGALFMEISTVDFVDDRLEEIAANLRKTNGEYAKAVERHKKLAKNVNDIITRDSDILLAECDRLDFQEYFDKEFVIAAIEQQAIYKQGLCDCVMILKDLGVLV